MTRPLTIAMLGPGASPHVTRLAAALAARGHVLHVLSEDKFAPFPAATGVAFYGIPSSLGFRGKAREVHTFLAQLRPDVLHSHAVNHGGYLGVASGFHPHVMTAWGSDILIAPDRSARHRLLTRLALRAADWVTSPAIALQTRMSAIGGWLPHNDIVQWGIDLAHFSREPHKNAFRERYGIGTSFFALSPRILQPLYNQDMMIEAWPAVLDAIPGALLGLVRYLPDPTYESKLRARAAELGVAESVRWLKPASYDELPGMYRAADVVLSIPGSDGTPITVLEAMACEATVVACDLPGLRDWIVDRGNGRLVDPRDAGSLAGAIVEAFRAEPDLRESMGKKARQTISERADREASLVRLEKIYRSAPGPAGFSQMRTLRNVLRF